MKLTDQSPYPFGEYKGTPMEDVPAQKLLSWRDWVLDQGGPASEDGKRVLEYIEENWQALTKEARDYDPKHKRSR